MTQDSLLQLLVCPETHQPLQKASQELLTSLNEAVANQSLKTRSGMLVSETLEAGLVRDDQKLLYPIRQGIPLMLIHEAICLSEKVLTS